MMLCRSLVIPGDRRPESTGGPGLCPSPVGTWEGHPQRDRVPHLRQQAVFHNPQHHLRQLKFSKERDREEAR